MFFSVMCTVSPSMSSYMNATGMLTVETFWCSMASIRYMKNRYSVAVTGYLCFFLVEVFTLFSAVCTSPSLYFSASLLLQKYGIFERYFFTRCHLVGVFGSITILSCSWFISFRMASSPGSPNTVSPLDIWHWVSIVVISGLCIMLSCWFGPTLDSCVYAHVVPEVEVSFAHGLYHGDGVQDFRMFAVNSWLYA